MKVRESYGKTSNVQGASGRDGKKVSDAKEVSFQGRLRQVESDNLEERINDLVKRIGEQGEKVGEKMDIAELKLYKQLISEFLDIAVGNSHKFSKRNFLDRRGRYRVYAIIRNVDEKLEQLTSDILSNEKDRIGILKKLDDIRGLILDLMM